MLRDRLRQNGVLTGRQAVGALMRRLGMAVFLLRA